MFRRVSPAPVGLTLLLFTLASCSDDTDPQVTPDASAPDQAVVVPDTLPLDAKIGPYPCHGYIYFCTARRTFEGGKTIYRPISVLADLNGTVVKQWDMFGMPSRMLPGGHVMGDARKEVTYPPDLQGVEIVQLDWAGDLQWSFRNWMQLGSYEGEEDDDESPLASDMDEEEEPDMRQPYSAGQHHDFQREGSPVGYYAPGQDALLKGSTLVLSNRLKKLTLQGATHFIDDDVVYLVDAASGKVTFKWYAFDHLDELGMDTARLKDLLKQTVFKGLLINSMSRLGKNRWHAGHRDSRFHPDNIMVSSRNANFIAIIDHVTGAVVWRLGPDLDKGSPGEKLGQIVGAHHVHMIPDGLPGAGNILVYDNGGLAGFGGASGFPKHSRNYSRLLEFNPVTLEKVWQHGGPMGTPGYFFSPFAGSAQRLPDGDTVYIHSGSAAVYRVNTKGENKWTLLLKNLNSNWYLALYRAIMIPPEWLPQGANAAGYKAWKYCGKTD